MRLIAFPQWDKLTSLLRGMGIREWHPEQGFPTAKQMSRMVAAEVEARDEREPQRRRAQDPAQGQSVRRHPRRGDEADRPHAQRPSAQVPELAHAPRGVHGAPAPPPPCRGLTPHRSLKWPAWEGGLAFGGHQARSSSEVRFTGLTENCHTTNQSQESTCLTMLCNECCVGYWKAGALCLGRLVDFGRGISRRIVPKRNPTFRWRLGPRGGLRSWKGD